MPFDFAVHSVVSTLTDEKEHKSHANDEPRVNSGGELCSFGKDFEFGRIIHYILRVDYPAEWRLAHTPI
jgi:hypothetical protein